LIQKGQLREGAYHLFLAAQREPGKWYHLKDLGMTLSELGDRDQAIEILTKANHLFKKETGQDFIKILSKIEDLKLTTQKEHITFEKSEPHVTTISHGVITKYNSDRGFGFIKDEVDDSTVFFHFSKIKNMKRPEEIKQGLHVKFVKEKAEKGMQASKIWLGTET